MADRKHFVFVERKKALQIAAIYGLRVIEEKHELTGYQIYIVEQWICDRKTNTNVVKVFTGDESHIIQVAVISISTAELQHPRPQIQEFLNFGTHLKLKPTPLGEIFLTDPSELPFDTDMMLIPDGDYDKWIKQVYVNINLRKTNCTGRSSLNLRPPNSASEEKFRNLYKIADTVSFQDTVINLVSLVQTALYLFNLLEKDCIDGLICNQTTAAFTTFYEKYHPVKATDFTLKEPWMEPHLLATIISKLVVCRNKLHENNFTTIKDPFADVDTFRLDIGDYQHYKSLRPTKYIDLDTLEALDKYQPTSQMSVRKVLKSKLDDISGITNSPLFSEISDPEMFRHHATIDSLKTIWRPKLKGGSNKETDSSMNKQDSSALTPISTTTSAIINNSNITTNSTTSSPHGNDQNELLHLIKSASAKTSRTSGAAVEMLTRKVTGSMPWISDSNGNNKRHATDRKHHQQDLALETSISLPTHSNNDHNDDEIVAIVSRISVPTRKPSPLSIQTSSNVSSNNSSNIVLDTTDDTIIPKQRPSPEHLDQDIPSYVQTVSNANTPSNTNTPINTSSPTTTANTSITIMKQKPTLRMSKSTDTSHPISHVQGGDFTPYVIEKKKQVRRTRSVSDSILRDPTFTEALLISTAEYSKKQESVKEETHHSTPHQLKRSNTISSPVISEKDLSHPQRPIATMNIKTYMTYERLTHQQKALQQAYTEIKFIADQYENTASQLKQAYHTRSQRFESIQRESKKVMDDQNETERRLKEVEDNSAKLHYELKVMNDKLKEIEDNVGTFYGKVGVLERKMEDSQQSITTMLIIVNYLNHYWTKVREWAIWLAKDEDHHSSKPLHD